MVVPQERLGPTIPLLAANFTDLQVYRLTAPLAYIGRYMHGWWDYAIADELHQLAQETAQGNNLGVLYRCSRRLIGLTGTLMVGYADHLFHLFYRMEPRRMVAEGLAAGSSGRRDFATQYGVMESIEKIPDVDKACTRSEKSDVRLVRRPGIAPALRQVPDGNHRFRNTRRYRSLSASIRGECD
jgi:hypothetical protein